MKTKKINTFLQININLLFISKDSIKDINNKDIKNINLSTPYKNLKEKHQQKHSSDIIHDIPDIFNNIIIDKNSKLIINFDNNLNNKNDIIKSKYYYNKGSYSLVYAINISKSIYFTNYNNKSLVLKIIDEELDTTMVGQDFSYDALLKKPNIKKHLPKILYYGIINIKNSVGIITKYSYLIMPLYETNFINNSISLIVKKKYY
jgi:hypothetical protein